MDLRRVVTGIGPDGRPAVVSDGKPPRTTDLKSVPGFSVSLVWATPGSPKIEGQPGEPTDRPSFLPDRHGTILVEVTFPPDSVMGSEDFDPAAAGAEQLATMPGFAESFEPEAPGMHTTDTVDYGIVLSGEVWLDLDDGNPTRLSAGDVVVQNGVRHAWRNPSDEPATMMFVLIGADRG